MLNQIRFALHRSQATLAQDALGVAALAVILLVGLHVPVLT